MQKTVLIFLTVTLMSLTTIAQGESTERGVKPCPCNRFRVISNLETVKAGESVEFEVQSDEPSVGKRKFEWTISSGKIISGQGTSRISVRAPSRESFEPSNPPIDRRGVRLFGTFTAVAALADTDCTCPGSSETVAVVGRNLERNIPADVHDIQLSHSLATTACPNGTLPIEGKVSGNTVIDVSAIASDRENDPLSYAYTITGGRIVGAGPNVKWDLSGVYPGTYTITAGADDGCGYCGKAQTKVVTVIACEPICVLCQCATVEVNGPLGEKLGAGENVFVANVTGGSYEPTYEWAVEGGEIVAGQGTPSISVKFDQKTLNSKASVKVLIGGSDRACACLAEQEIEYINGRRKP